MNSVFDGLSQLWARMSSRERSLALGVAAAALLTVVVTGSRVAFERLSNLDAGIAQLEGDLIQYRQQVARQKSVEAQYREVAAQHSSAWSEAEIHDRLRQEIYRLAQNVPPALDDRGIPMTLSSNTGNLVDIPSLQQGRLEESGEGYREYSLSFRIPSAELKDLFAFIERLQGSPQSLRIDGFDMNRGSQGTIVDANFRITRTIVSGLAGEVEDGPQTPAVSDGLDLVLSEWQSEGLRVEEEGAALTFQALEGPGVGYTVRTLPGGYAYEMDIDLRCTGNAGLAIAFDHNGEVFSGQTALNNDGRAYRYRIRFVLPGSPTDRIRLRAPYIQLKDATANAVLSRLALQRAG